MSENINIICPNCKAEFPMKEGLKSHLDSLEKTTIENVKEVEQERIKKLENDKKNQEEKTKKLEEKIKQSDLEKSKEIKKAIEEDRASNKEHYDAVLENAIKKNREDQHNKFSEDKNKWELEKNRLNKQIQTLNQTVNQGTTVDQGSGAEISLGDYLKKTFKDKSDKIKEYAKGVPGGDWLHEVIENDRTVCKILYERKNTKNWSNDWKKKLQSDMKDSKSDIGIIFTRSTPKDFPKDASWHHEGNIFICKYDFPTLKNLATTQRWAHVLIDKQRGDKTENAISAIEFLDSPIVKNLIMQKINISEKKRKKMKLTLQNLNDAIDLDEQMDDSLEEFFKEIEKIGISAFLDKWNK